MKRINAKTWLTAAMVVVGGAATVVTTVAHDGDHRFQAFCTAPMANEDIVSEPNRWHLTRSGWAGTCSSSVREATIEARDHNMKEHGGKKKASVLGPAHSCLY